MQFFMKEFRILQHCDERDRSRLKINLGKQGYVKGLMGHGKEALVDAKKAFLMGEDDKDWRSEGSGFLRYNYLNVIFLHWMGIEENARHSMGTKWWMTRELKALQLPEHSLSALRESNAALIPTNSGVKPNTHEELVHNMIIAVYRVQARPRLLSPRIHPGHHRFWKNVVEKYVVLIGFLFIGMLWALSRCSLNSPGGASTTQICEFSMLNHLVVGVFILMLLCCVVVDIIAM